MVVTKSKNGKSAVELHEHVPANWYHRSIKENIFQRYWHNRRFKEVKKFSEKVKGVILDIGAADGLFTEIVLKTTKAKKVIGIDVLKSSVDWANDYYKKNKKLEFKLGDAHKLNFPPSTFDAVYALEVLEHVHDPQKVLKEIKRVLKKGGHAILLVPAENLIFKIVWLLWNLSGRMIWKDAHLHHYSNDQLVKLCKDVGFEVVENNKFILNMLHLIKVRKK